jgi:hypothetical protein
MHRRALELKEKALGQEHPSTLSMNSLTEVLQSQGKFAAAKEKKDERNKVISWLSSTDPLLNQNAANKKHLSGTGEWFLKGPSMKIWKLRNSLLWVYGIR